MDTAVNPGADADHSPGPVGLRRRCKNCRINSGIPTRSRYGTRAPITTICGPSNPPTRLSSTANGVATAIATHNPLRQDPTTPLKRRCASNPTSRPPRKNRSSPDSMAGIANSTSAGSQEDPGAERLQLRVRFHLCRPPEQGRRRSGIGRNQSRNGQGRATVSSLLNQLQDTESDAKQHWRLPVTPSRRSGSS